MSNVRLSAISSHTNKNFHINLDRKNIKAPPIKAVNAPRITEHQKFIDNILHLNPHMAVKLGEKFGQFTLFEKTNTDNKITFTQDAFAHLPIPQFNKYNLDISAFDNSSAGTRPFIVLNNKIPVKFQIRTKEKGILDEERYYRENTETPPRLMQTSLRFRDKNGKIFQIHRTLKPEMERAVYIFDPDKISISAKKSVGNSGKLFPTSSIGKIFTAAMLMKTFEDVETNLDKSPNTHQEKQDLLKKHHATTLMDVPLKDNFAFLERHNAIKNKDLARKSLDFLKNIPLEGAENSPERQDNAHHQDSITPRMLLNHTAKIPESAFWKNKQNQQKKDEPKKSGDPNEIQPPHAIGPETKKIPK